MQLTLFKQIKFILKCYINTRQNRGKRGDYVKIATLKIRKKEENRRRRNWVGRRRVWTSGINSVCFSPSGLLSILTAYTENIRKPVNSLSTTQLPTEHLVTTCQDWTEAFTGEEVNSFPVTPINVFVCFQINFYRRVCKKQNAMENLNWYRTPLADALADSSKLNLIFLKGGYLLHLAQLLQSLQWNKINRLAPMLSFKSGFLVSQIWLAFSLAKSPW